MGERSYRSTPEREEAIRRQYRLHDYLAPKHLPSVPPLSVEALERRFSEEDAVIDEFGELRKFNWTVTYGELTTTIRQVSTPTEAFTKAIQEWAVVGLPKKGPLKAVREDGKEF